jgi:hypothetical protein
MKERIKAACCQVFLAPRLDKAFSIDGKHWRGTFRAAFTVIGYNRAVWFVPSPW